MSHVSERQYVWRGHEVLPQKEDIRRGVREAIQKEDINRLRQESPFRSAPAGAIDKCVSKMCDLSWLLPATIITVHVNHIIFRLQNRRTFVSIRERDRVLHKCLLQET